MAIKKKLLRSGSPVRKKQKIKPVSQKAQQIKSGFIDHFVSKKIADEMIKRGREAHLLPPMQFSSDSVKEIFEQKGVAFLRIYAVINAAGEQTYLLTGGSIDHKRIDVVRKKSRAKGIASRGTDDETGDMNIAQICDPVKKVYPKAGE